MPILLNIVDEVVINAWKISEQLPMLQTCVQESLYCNIFLVASFMHIIPVLTNSYSYKWATKKNILWYMSKACKCTYTTTLMEETICACELVASKSFRHIGAKICLSLLFCLYNISMLGKYLAHSNSIRTSFILFKTFQV